MMRLLIDVCSNEMQPVASSGSSSNSSSSSSSSTAQQASMGVSAAAGSKRSVGVKGFSLSV
jgi:hypothetical protein